ncbi:MAG: cell division protein FtsZ [Nanoarchaeota archaeon]|nr:cell division protein FtsZ [Nanoarchaeota archaeon]
MAKHILSMMLEDARSRPAIKVLGIGGAGCNIIDWLHGKKTKGVKTYAINTDKQHLGRVKAHKKIQIGKKLTRGLGCGGMPDKGVVAAKESRQEIKKILSNTRIAFICAGLGGGTGTGAAPEIARMAKEQGATVIGAAIMPLEMEHARVDNAELGLEMLIEHSDAIIAIDNNKLLKIAGNLPVQQAFAVANDLISNMIKSVAEAITPPRPGRNAKAITKNRKASITGHLLKNRVEEAVKKVLEKNLIGLNYETSRILDKKQRGRARMKELSTGANSQYALERGKSTEKAHFGEDTGIGYLKKVG